MEKKKKIFFFFFLTITIILINIEKILFLDYIKDKTSIHHSFIHA